MDTKDDLLRMLNTAQKNLTDALDRLSNDVTNAQEKVNDGARLMMVESLAKYAAAVAAANGARDALISACQAAGATEDDLQRAIRD